MLINFNRYGYEKPALPNLRLDLSIQMVKVKKIPQWVKMDQLEHSTQVGVFFWADRPINLDVEADWGYQHTILCHVTLTSQYLGQHIFTN